MEITLEKIELVKDRTGVSYKEAKEALEKADGSVVDAIIAIEEAVDEEKKPGKSSNLAGEILEKVKELIRKGNIVRIMIRRDEETILNVPLNAGIVGAVVAPWGVIAGIIAAFGFRCTIQLVKDDGSVINVSEKAENLGKEVVEKGSVVVDDVAAKGQEAYQSIKNAASGKIQEFKNRMSDSAEEDEETGEETEEKRKTSKRSAGERFAKAPAAEEEPEAPAQEETPAPEACAAAEETPAEAPQTEASEAPKEEA